MSFRTFWIQGSETYGERMELVASSSAHPSVQLSQKHNPAPSLPLPLSQTNLLQRLQGDSRREYEGLVGDKLTKFQHLCEEPSLRSLSQHARLIAQAREILSQFVSADSETIARKHGIEI